MLSPDVVEIGEDIAASYSQFLALNSFGTSISQTVVSPLSPDPGWLPTLRRRLATLAKLCAQWQLDYPDLLSSYFLPFTDFSSTFGAFARQSGKFGNNVEVWVQALTALHKAAVEAETVTKRAATGFTDHFSMIKTIEGQLNESLATAWQELANEEDKIVAIATQVARLQDRVAQLQDNLTSGTISAGKSYFQTAATITYTVLTSATVEIPYLAILSEIYTIGKEAYDLIVTDKEISEALQKIADLTVEASEAAQAAAMSKGVIQLITRLNLQVTGQSDHLPALNRVWEVAAEKISAAIDAIQAGAVPTQVLDLVSMPAAAAGWNTLAKLSRDAVTMVPVQGRPVFLTNSSVKSRLSATRF
ncbi:alpha-pore-forming cytotoxin subunit MakB [Azospirillum lipoferum]|uniref:Uncharacterized protein n=1 Tax=Azospirillum lipoferum (strain 4B) TaxID=862719 RepID=G7ZI38_AZOL4|nr:hypothetical protein [Azospirillum lipoferum]CBS91128.1 Conserved protein of unknown function [Azospirillum lipoferum 4B]